MNDFIRIVQWSAICNLLFFSGFDLASQVTNNSMQWGNIDWTLPMFLWGISGLIFYMGKIFSENKASSIEHKHQLQ